MPGALQSKGDGEYPYSAPFTGLNLSLPSIVLPPTAQDAATSPNFSIVRGSIAAPWPYTDTLFGSTLNSGEYLLFVTASGYVVTNQAIYQIQPTATPATAWQLVSVATMPPGAWPAQGNNNPIPFIETNGCLFFACNLGIYFYSPLNTPTIKPWAINFSANYLTIFNQRMVLVGLFATTQATIPGLPSGAQGASGTLADGTYYAVVTALFGDGTESAASLEGTGTVIAGGGAADLVWTWTAVPGAVSYNIYIGSAAGEENEVFNVAVNTFDLTSYSAGTVSPPVVAPITPWTVAWSAVSTFSNLSVGSFNAAPNTDAGVVGGWDVLTNYSQGIPVGIVNLGHSIYIQMTQGIVEMDPAASGLGPYTFYNYWQERIPVGAIQGSVDQFGPIASFLTPDNVNVWIPGSQTQIGLQVMPLIRSLLINTEQQIIAGAAYPLIQNPTLNASFYTFYNELHYALIFQMYGVKPGPGDQLANPSWFGLLLDYNFASQAWSMQIVPPLTTKLFQVNGPPITETTFSGVPSQSFLIAGSQEGPNAPTEWVVFAGDVFNRVMFSGYQCQALASVPQPCQVGFPQTPISAGHRPAVRRVRIEYSWDEMALASGPAPVDLEITMTGTITQNTGSSGGNGVATTSIFSKTVTIQVEPPGAVGNALATAIIPCLTATAYADFVLSVENPQVTLQWTDPSAEQRLLIHRITLLCNDTKGTTQ
jgi:hypothetical protein